jgi:hypothetical protein
MRKAKTIPMITITTSISIRVKARFAFSPNDGVLAAADCSIFLGG